MNTNTPRRPRRPKLHLPLFLCDAAAKAPSVPVPAAFPLSPDQLRRAVADMIG